MNPTSVAATRAPNEAPVVRAQYRADIDGLRAIAVVSVVLFHAGIAALSGGYVGVDVFFVISGYLIGAHIYQDVAVGRFSLAEFYRRRAKRILPALFVLLIVCFLLAVLLLNAEDLIVFARYAVSSIFSLSNLMAWHRASDYFASDMVLNPLLMTWTLAVEEQFYIFFPLLMLLLQWSPWQGRDPATRWRRTLALGVVLSIVSFALCVWVITRDQTAAFYLTVFRAWELGAGVLMAVYEQKPGRPSAGKLYGGTRFADLRSVAGLVCILYSVFSYGPGTLFPGRSALAPVVGAVLLLSAPTAWLNRFVLSSRPLRWIGLVSYSWYLWHWPLLSFATYVSDAALTPRTGLIVVLVALGVAWASWKFIERPFRRSQRAAGPLLWRYAAAGTALAAVGVVLSSMHGLPRRYPAVETLEHKLFPPPGVRTCFGAGSLTSQDVCIPKADGRPTVAILGDSHAHALEAEMSRLAQAQGMRVVTLSLIRCPPLLGVTDVQLGTMDTDCLKFNRDSLAYLSSDPTITTVIVAAFWARPETMPGEIHRFVRPGQNIADLDEATSEANLELGLDAMVAALKATGKRVVLVQDNASLRIDPRRKFESNMIPARRWIATHVLGQRTEETVAGEGQIFVQQDERARAIVAKVASQYRTEVFDLSSHLCHGHACRYVVDGQLLYWDPSHLDDAGIAIALQGFPLTPGRHSP